LTNTINDPEYQVRINCARIPVIRKLNCFRTLVIKRKRSRRGRDRMVVGFTTAYAIITYHHWCCEFESRSGRGV